MYPLPANPTLADIIRRSIVCHPSLLAKALDAIAGEDRRFAASRAALHALTNVDAIINHAEQAETGARLTRGEHVDTFDNESAADWAIAPLGVQIIVANAAAKLQCLPRHILTQAAIRSDESKEPTSGR